MSIENYRKKIEEIFNDLDVISGGVTTLKKLGEIATIKGGNGFPIKYQGITDDNLIPFYKVGDMNSAQNNIYMMQANNYVEEAIILDEIKGTIFEPNTIIFPKVGMAIKTNKKRLLTRRAAIDNNVMAIVVNEKAGVLTKFLFEYFVFVVDLNDYASGANPPSISASNISELKIPVPPLDVQQKIIDECEAYESKIAEAEKKLEELKGKTNEILKKYLN